MAGSKLRNLVKLLSRNKQNKIMSRALDKAGQYDDNTIAMFDRMPDEVKTALVLPHADILNKDNLALGHSKILPERGFSGNYEPSTNEITLSYEQPSQAFHEMMHGFSRLLPTIVDNNKFYKVPHGFAADTWLSIGDIDKVLKSYSPPVDQKTGAVLWDPNLNQSMYETPNILMSNKAKESMMNELTGDEIAKSFYNNIKGDFSNGQLNIDTDDSFLSDMSTIQLGNLFADAINRRRKLGLDMLDAERETYYPLNLDLMHGLDYYFRPNVHPLAIASEEGLAKTTEYMPFRWFQNSGAGKALMNRLNDVELSPDIEYNWDWLN